MESRRFEISASLAGQRLDQILASLLPEVSRSRAAQLIKDGSVMLDGHAAKPAAVVKEGQYIEATVAPRPILDVVAQELALDIVFEDEHLLVVNKAAGMVVHPAAGNPDGTLVNALLFHVPELADQELDDRPGIVHRLDKGTSGLLVIGKTGPATHSLQRQFASRTVTKMYLAVVIGQPEPKEGRIELAIGRHFTERKKISSHTAKGRPATTLYRVEASRGGLSVLTCTLLTGRTHQIRVHCAEGGWPLVGDETYGGVRAIKRITEEEPRAACQALQRPALHSRLLAFDHPATGERLSFTAPIPDDLRPLLRLLEYNHV